MTLLELARILFEGAWDATMNVFMPIGQTKRILGWGLGPPASTPPSFIYVDLTNGTIYLQSQRKVNLVAATQTLTAAQSGQKFVGAVDAVFTLPLAATALKGVWYEFECGALSSGTGLSVSPNAADYIYGAGFNPTLTADKDMINTGATDRLGDMLRIYCNGSAWVIELVIGTWAREI